MTALQLNQIVKLANGMIYKLNATAFDMDGVCSDSERHKKRNLPMKPRCSLIDWLDGNPATYYYTNLRKLPKTVQVCSHAPDLWHLDDYEVVLPLAGQSVLLQPRINHSSQKAPKFCLVNSRL